MKPDQKLAQEFLATTSSRRSFLRKAGLASMVGAVAPALAPLLTPSSVQAATPSPALDIAILNFALNLEYLEAQYYNYAVHGQSIQARGVPIIAGDGTPGGTVKIKANPQVPFENDTIAQYALEIAQDELNHVAFLRKALGTAAVGQPDLDLETSFSALAELAGLGAGFDPFASDVAFLLGAFIFEDVGVTAYHGAAPLIYDKGILGAAAGILAVEAYHASEVRTILYGMAVEEQSLPSATEPPPARTSIFEMVAAISDLRDSVDNTHSDKDQGIRNDDGSANIVPTDANSLVFARTTKQILRIVYGMGAPKAPKPGTFFPVGMNGAIR